MKVLSASKVRWWEGKSGVSEAELMGEAVGGCLGFVEDIVEKRPVVVLCGKGNNGNDGLLLAYELRQRGWVVEVVLSHEPKDRTAHPFGHLEEFIHQAKVWPSTPEKTGKPKLVIDALLGTGVKGAIRGHLRQMLEWARANKGNRDIYISIDLPSGLEPDTGEANEVTFPADYTCAIGAVKQGCVMDSARDFVGKIIGVPLSLPANVNVKSESEFLTERDIRPILKSVPHNTHKHRRGRVSVWGGLMPGAAILAARAALRAGAGTVQLYLRREFFGMAISQTPELIVRQINEDETLPQDFFQCHAHVIGPGLGQHPLIQERFFEVLPCLNHPTVLDADALNFLANDLEQLERIEAPTILTPHIGEMRRLVGGEFDERSLIAAEWARSKGGTLILKGAHTVMASQGETLACNSSGNPGMATAGMGDVLSGILAGLMAQGYTPWEAARAGVFWHGLAGDLAERERSAQSLIATDVIETLGTAWKKLFSE